MNDGDNYETAVGKVLEAKTGMVRLLRGLHIEYILYLVSSHVIYDMMSGVEPSPERPGRTLNEFITEVSQLYPKNVLLPYGRALLDEVQLVTEVTGCAVQNRT